jgi:hypothetical protein
MLILDGRWKLLPKWLRVVLFLVSPMMVVFIGLAVLFANAAAVEHFHKHHFAKSRVIERITGVDFPKYKFVDYKRCGGGHGPVHYDAELEFENMPDEAFYKALEKRGDYYIDNNDSVRTFSFKKPYKYLSLDSYYDLITYGDAFIEVREGSRTFKVTLFEWPGNNQFFLEED